MLIWIKLLISIIGTLWEINVVVNMNNMSIQSKILNKCYKVEFWYNWYEFYTKACHVHRSLATQYKNSKSQ